MLLSKALAVAPSIEIEFIFLFSISRITASGFLNDNFRYSNLDYGNVMDCTFYFENHVAAYSKVLRLAAFNVYHYNRDDHSNNISFLMNALGEWKLAPAYDLTFSNSSHGLHSTMIAGESKSPG